ncbi:MULTISPECIES: transposase [Xenorhabdus]|nr:MULTISPECIES: transposase [Xenorhabdus]
MPRLYGYSEKGRRCLGTHDWHAKGRLNVMGAICEECLFLVRHWFL